MNRSQHNTYQFKLADIGTWALIKRFHKQTKLSTPLQTDSVFYVLDGQNIVGVARFVKHHQAWWLRGLYIQPEHRQKRLATELIEFAFQSLDAPCYAFAQPHLEQFYQALNFQPHSQAQLSADFTELFTRYQANKPHLQIWYRA